MSRNKVKRDINKIKESLSRKEEKVNELEIVYKSHFTYDKWHYAECDDNGKLMFIKYRNGQSEIVGSIKISNPDDPDREISVFPAPQIAQTRIDRVLQEEQQEVIKFPPKPVAYVSEYDLYCEIKDFIHQFIELMPEDEIILALYILRSSVYDILKDSSFPFIHVLAPFGKGKSRLLTVMSEITPYGFYSVDIKSAALKRVSDIYGVVVFVDEKGDMDSELASILNGKYNANSIILNANNEVQQGVSAIIGYRIYGPLVMAGRSPFKDDAIESKSFQVNMDFEMTRDDVPRKIKGRLHDDFREIGLKIRGQLLNFRIKWHDRINEIEEGQFLKLYEDHTEPRLFEVISFFEDLIEIIPQIKHEIGKVLKSQIIRNVEVASQTPNGIIANEVLTLMQSEDEIDQYSVNGRNYRGIYLSAIYDELGKNYAKQVGKILSALGLKTDRPRIRKTRKGQNGQTQEYTKRYSMVRFPDEKKMRELRSRYDPEFVIAKLTTIEQGPHTTLDVEDYEDNDLRGGNSKDDDEKNDESMNLHDQFTENTEKSLTISKNDSPHSPLNPEINDEIVKSDVQNEIQITEEEANQLKDSLLKQGIHLNASDTSVSRYGDKYNLAIPVNFYHQNTEKVDQLMTELGFKKGNNGTLHNVFFSRPLKRGVKE